MVLVNINFPPLFPFISVQELLQVVSTTLTPLLYHTVTVGGVTSCSGYTLEAILSSLLGNEGIPMERSSIMSSIMVLGFVPGSIMLADGLKVKEQISSGRELHAHS